MRTGPHLLHPLAPAWVLPLSRCHSCPAFEDGEGLDLALPSRVSWAGEGQSRWRVPCWAAQGLVGPGRAVACARGWQGAAEGFDRCFGAPGAGAGGLGVLVWVGKAWAAAPASPLA